MNTNRDKAVSFGRDGGDVRRPVFLSMSQSRMFIRSSSGGARAEYRPLAV